MNFWWMAFLMTMPLPAAAVPAFLPGQDVVIDYAVSAPGRSAQAFEVSYEAGPRLARVNDAAHGVSYLADLNAGEVEILVPMLRAMVEAPDMSRFAGMLQNADGAQFVRLGHGHYAGLACETYLVTNAQGSGTACLTHDGEILHFHGHDNHGAVDITATSVRFGAVPASVFSVPADFSHLQLPPGMLAQLLK